MLRQSNPAWDITKKIKGLTAKKLNIASRFKLLEALDALPGIVLDFLLFFSADNLSLRIFFWSSEWEASSSDSYSCSSSHPSLLLSASFINFCRFFMSCLPSATSLRTSYDSFKLSAIWPKMRSNCALSLNCFLLPLNLNSAASLTTFDFPSSCLLPSSSWDAREVLNRSREKT